MQKLCFLVLVGLIAFSFAQDQGYVTPFVDVMDEDLFESNLLGGPPVLESQSPQDISLVAKGLINPDTNASYWFFYRRVLDPENLSIVSTNNYTVHGGRNMSFYNGYAFEFIYQYPTTNSCRIMVRQTHLDDNVTLPLFHLVSGTSYLEIIDSLAYGDTVFLAITDKNSLKITSFKLGGSSIGKMIAIPTNSIYYNTKLKLGEALSEGQVFLTAGNYGNRDYDDGQLDILADMNNGTYQLHKFKPGNSPRKDGYTCDPYVTNDTFGSICLSIHSTYQGNGYIYTYTANFSDTEVAFFQATLDTKFYTFGSQLITFNSERSMGIFRVHDIKTKNCSSEFDWLGGDNFQASNGNVYALNYQPRTAFSDRTNLTAAIVFKKNSTTPQNNDDTLIQYFLA